MLCPRAALRPSPRSAARPVLVAACALNPLPPPGPRPPASRNKPLKTTCLPEASIAALLAANLPPAAHSIRVRDISGGCGSMYAIHVASPLFRGLPLLRQQRLVTKALGDRVRDWHGLQIRTDVLDDGPGSADATP